MKTSVAPLTRLHTQPVVQVEAAATPLTLLLIMTHGAALRTFCTVGRRLIGKCSRGTLSCAGLLGSQEKTCIQWHKDIQYTVGPSLITRAHFDL